MHCWTSQQWHPKYPIRCGEPLVWSGRVSFVIAQRVIVEQAFPSVQGTHESLFWEACRFPHFPNRARREWRVLRPGGSFDNSPAIYRWGTWCIPMRSPTRRDGRNARSLPLPSLRDLPAKNARESIPSDKSLGYCRESLRDKNLGNDGCTTKQSCYGAPAMPDLFRAARWPEGALCRRTA
jgi:hypothetical protein